MCVWGGGGGGGSEGIEKAGKREGKTFVATKVIHVAAPTSDARLQSGTVTSVSTLWKQHGVKL